MAFKVNWLPEAEARLTEIWVSAEDRQRITLAARFIDESLSKSPGTLSESRAGND